MSDLVTVAVSIKANKALRDYAEKHRVSVNYDVMHDVLEFVLAAVAPLIAAQERERAATMVDGYADAIAQLSGGTVPSVIDVACSTIAAAIRARGTP